MTKKQLPTTLILIRHGETDWNNELRFQGQADTELTETGRQHGRAAAEALRGEEIAAIYASDLKRARECAEMVAEVAQVAVKSSPALREARFGDWEGLSLSEVEARYPELLQAWFEDSLSHRPPHGETLQKLYARVRKFLGRIAKRHRGQTVVVATHGGPIKAAVCHALQANLTAFRKIRIDNGSMTRLEVSDEAHLARNTWDLVNLNEVCHLDDESNGSGVM